MLSPGGRSTIVSCSSRRRRGKEVAGPDGRGGHHRVLSAWTTHGSAGAASVGPMSQSSRASPPASSRRPCPGHNINFSVRRTLTPGRQLAPRRIKPVPKLHLMLLLTDALSPSLSLCSPASHSRSFFLSDAQSSVSPPPPPALLFAPVMASVLRGRAGRTFCCRLLQPQAPSTNPSLSLSLSLFHLLSLSRRNYFLRV